MHVNADTLLRRAAVLGAALLLSVALGGCAQFFRGFRKTVPVWDGPQFKFGSRQSTYGSTGAPAPAIKTKVTR